MSIELKSSSSKMPKALKLLNSISSFLFEEECGECKFMKEGELKALRKAAEIISKAHTRNLKKSKS